MANSRRPGPLGSEVQTAFRFVSKYTIVPARTPGPLGQNDQSTPGVTSVLGDTPGPLGKNDHGAPNSLQAKPFTPLFTPKDILATSSSPNEQRRRSYTWTGHFNWQRIEDGMAKRFKNNTKFGSMSKPHLKTLLNLLEEDLDVSDIRWMAYILATAYWETSHVEQVTVSEKSKKGSVITRKKRFWVNMKPVEETGHGAGRNYGLPVKVKRLPTGEALVTEQDGDQFVVQINGNYRAVAPRARMGSSFAASPTKMYEKADGTSLAYYGRGYVQLTWWANYAKAGAYLGKGLDFLLQPDKVMEASTAYAIMSFGMRTGKGLANGRRLEDYFCGDKRDYVGARRMVNGTDHCHDIAKVAILFEDVLYEGREI